MKQIQLWPTSRELFALVDDEDYERLMKFRWTKHMRGYAQRSLGSCCGSRLMHKEVLGEPPIGQIIHHKDHNKLNNQKLNLEFTTQRRNTQNYTRGTSKYIGVCWERLNRKWMSYIRINGKSQTIGLFYSEEDAARAYDKRALAQWGLEAFQNFPNNQLLGEVVATPGTIARYSDAELASILVPVSKPLLGPDHTDQS